MAANTTAIAFRRPAPTQAPNSTIVQQLRAVVLGVAVGALVALAAMSAIAVCRIAVAPMVNGALTLLTHPAFPSTF